MKGMGLLLVLVLSAACGGRGPRPADPPRPPPLPVATPTVCVGTHHLRYTELNELNALRSRCTRTTLYADTYEHSDAARAEFIQGLSLAWSHEIKVLVVVHQVPDDWTTARDADPRATSEPGMLPGLPPADVRARCR